MVESVINRADPQAINRNPGSEPNDGHSVEHDGIVEASALKGGDARAGEAS